MSNQGPSVPGSEFSNVTLPGASRPLTFAELEAARSGSINLFNSLGNMVPVGGSAPVRMAGSVRGRGGLPPLPQQPVGKLPVKAFHTTDEVFQNYDWSRLGKSTAENAGGTSVEQWANNLAKIGPWANERSLIKEFGGGVSMPVEIGGKAKTFASLDALEMAVRKAGDPSAFRRALVERGYGHIAVKDTEFGGRSFIALTPENFKISNQISGGASAANRLAPGDPQ
jgi:hypothetical protein